MGLDPRQIVLRHVYHMKGIKEARRWASWPFVDMNWDQNLLTKGTENLSELNEQSLWRCALLHVHSFHNAHEIWAIDTDMHAAWCFICTASEVTAVFFGIEAQDGNSLVERGLKEGWIKLPPKNRDRTDMTALWQIISKHPTLNEQDVERIMHEVISKNLAWLCRAFEHLRTSDKYAVEVLPSKISQRMRKKSKKPWLNQGRRIIFMRPGERRAYRPNNSDDTGNSPSPHHRRGCWRTLRDERYARNPDGTPRMIWARPAWIGPTEWILDGSIYRVILDENDTRVRA